MRAIWLCRLLAIGLLSSFFLITSSHARADVLYAATGNGNLGNLYTLNLATGAVITDIGPLHDSGAGHYGLTGLSFQPGTGTLYGATINAGGTALPQHLVT